MAPTSASWIAKPGPSAPNSGITVRMMSAIAASSVERIGRITKRGASSIWLKSALRTQPASPLAE